MSSSVSVACPACRFGAAVPPERLGQTVQCRRCGATFVLQPAPDDAFVPVAPAPVHQVRPQVALNPPHVGPIITPMTASQDEAGFAPTGAFASSSRSDDRFAPPVVTDPQYAGSAPSAPEPGPRTADTGGTPFAAPSDTGGVPPYDQPAGPPPMPVHLPSPAHVPAGHSSSSRAGRVSSVSMASPAGKTPGRPTTVLVRKSGSGVPMWAVGAGAALAGLVVVLLILLFRGGGGRTANPGPIVKGDTTKPSDTAKNGDAAVKDDPADADPPVADPKTPATKAGSSGTVDPPTVPPVSEPPNETPDRFKERIKKLDDLEAADDAPKLADALRDFRAWGKTLAASPRREVSQWAAEVETDYRKRFGDYWVARAELKLPAPNADWPGLDKVPTRGGRYRIFDGSKLHTRRSLGVPSYLVDGAIKMFSGDHPLKRTVAAVKDFELHAELTLGERADWYLMYHFRFGRNEPASLLTFGAEEVTLRRTNTGSRRDEKPIFTTKLDKPMGASADVRVIVHGGKVRVFVNGQAAGEGADTSGAGRWMFGASGPVTVKKLQLTLLDASPAKAPDDEYPEEGTIGSGTGWVVAPGGYLMTNWHVIDDALEGGTAKVKVRIDPDPRKPALPARIIAHDRRRDMALLRMDDPAALGDRKPLPIDSGREVQRGEDVAALGFPLSTTLGAGITLTQGIVSKTPAPDNDNLLILSTKVNPGNSGGPLVDGKGNVQGMVTFKIGGDEAAYGGAIPAKDVAAFLARHLRTHKPTPLFTEEFTTRMWLNVDKLVSPSVLMIVLQEDEAAEGPAGGAEIPRKGRDLPDE